MSDYLAINRANWDDRAPIHAAAYGLERYVNDPGHLSHAVRFDQPRLGEVSGLRGVHLQCHIGTDTISLARLGARMSGLDFSPASLAEARKLADLTGTAVDFHEADVYRAAEVLGHGGFDLVYTGLGAIYWLPDMTRWARVAADLLRPGGRLFIREGHPMLLAFDDKSADLTLGYPYFGHDEPLVFDDPRTYADPDANIAHSVTHEWSHGLGEVVTAVLDAGMRLTQFVEHDSVPWEALPGRMVVDDDGEWRLAERPQRLAASFTLQAVKM